MLSEYSPALSWFLLGFLFMLAELVLPYFVTVFFGFGAWVTALSVLLGLASGLNTQLVIFIGSSLLALLLFRTKTGHLGRGEVSMKGADIKALEDFKGSVGVVVADIHPNRSGGKVELHGTNWNAVSDVTILIGTSVEVIHHDNLTLKVKPQHNK
jgi:membrane protein implicated in regulation of membrane protease activity